MPETTEGKLGLVHLLQILQRTDAAGVKLVEFGAIIVVPDIDAVDSVGVEAQIRLVEDGLASKEQCEPGPVCALTVGADKEQLILKGGEADAVAWVVANALMDVVM